MSRVLPPAIRLWLQTQLDEVAALTFKIEGRDRQLLSGHIPAVQLAAQKAVYRGIHLRQATVTASGIRINLKQIIRRQPLRLLASFPVSGKVLVTEEDLNYSLQSPLLGEGIYEFLRLIANSQPDAEGLKAVLAALSSKTVLSGYHPTATIEPDNITLMLTPHLGQSLPAITFSTHLVVRDGHHLCLENPRWLNHGDTNTSLMLGSLQGFEINLGPEVAITECAIQAHQLALAGTLQVLPEPAPEQSS